jgi:hypothetical protein
MYFGKYACLLYSLISDYVRCSHLKSQFLMSWVAHVIHIWFTKQWKHVWTLFLNYVFDNKHWRMCDNSINLNQRKIEKLSVDFDKPSRNDILTYDFNIKVNLIVCTPWGPTVSGCMLPLLSNFDTRTVRFTCRPLTVGQTATGTYLFRDLVGPTVRPVPWEQWHNSDTCQE